MAGPPELSQCPYNHDPYTLVLSSVLCVGLIVSYLPQHLRIIMAGTSEGLSPFFLLLGATSSASGMLNLLIMQWPLIQCCRVVGAGQCAESMLRFVQVFLQWLLFSIILVLYLIYFPRIPKILPSEETVADVTGEVDVGVEERRMLAIHRNKREWKEAVGVAWLVLLHLVVLTLLTLILLTTLPTTRPPHPILRRLAAFCGLSATLLAVLQYAPQIAKTYNAKLVGALSLGTMAIQVPGSILFCASIIAGEGTDWTSWLPYAVTGAMQASLLVICLAWKRRQKTLGVDDFGKPVVETEANGVNGHSDEHTALLGNGNGNGN